MLFRKFFIWLLRFFIKPKSNLLPEHRCDNSPYRIPAEIEKEKRKAKSTSRTISVIIGDTNQKCPVCAGKPEPCDGNGWSSSVFPTVYCAPGSRYYHEANFFGYRKECKLAKFHAHCRCTHRNCACKWIIPLNVKEQELEIEE